MNYNLHFIFVKDSKCEVFEKTCDNGTCIGQWLLCNGKNDCLDGSDEYPSLCGGKNMFL